MSERRVGLIGGLMTAIGPVSMAIYTPAMPEIVRALGTSEAMVKLTLTLYFGGFAAGQLVAGPLSDALGRRAVTFGFMGVYCLASLAGLMAQDVGMLMAARFVQGVGASAGIAISRALVRDLFQGERSARIMNLIGIILAAGPAVAPTVGGLAARRRRLAVGLRRDGRLRAGGGHRHRHRHARDGGGRRRRACARGRSRRAYAAILADRRFLTSAGIVACAVGALYAQATFLPFILMGRVGLSPAAFGLAMLFQSGSFLLGSLATRALLDRVGAGRLVAPGLGFIAAGSLGLLLLNLRDPSLLGVMLPVALSAFGIAFVMPATTTDALAPFPAHAGAAAAMMGFLQLGLGLAVGSLGAAIGDPVRAMALLIPAMGAAACLLYRRATTNRS